MFKYKVMWYLYKFHLISEERYIKYSLKLTFKIIEEHKEVFIRLKNS